MSEVDNLKAQIYDLEDEFTCLKIDLMLVENDEAAEKIKKVIDELLLSLTSIYNNLIELECRKE